MHSIIITLNLRRNTKHSRETNVLLFKKRRASGQSGLSWIEMHSIIITLNLRRITKHSREPNVLLFEGLRTECSHNNTVLRRADLLLTGSICCVAVLRYCSYILHSRCSFKLAINRFISRDCNKLKVFVDNSCVKQNAR
jgi:hypothetical protein